jgi:hypothetical protein
MFELIVTVKADVHASSESEMSMSISESSGIDPLEHDYDDQGHSSDMEQTQSPDSSNADSGFENIPPPPGNDFKCLLLVHRKYF